MMKRRLSKMARELKLSHDECKDTFELTSREMIGKINNTLNTGLQEKTRYRKQKLWKAVIIVAAIALLGVSIVLASTSLWYEKLTEYFNPSNEQIRELVDSVNTPHATISQNGLEITVQQTISDSRGLYILYELTLPEDIDITPSEEYPLQYQFESIRLKGEADNRITYYEDIIEQMGNKRVVLLCCYTDSKIENQQLELTFKNFRKHINTLGPEAFEPVVNGEWILTWDLEYESHEKTYAVNRFCQIFDSSDQMDKTIYITDITVSPLSVSVNFTADYGRLGNTISTWIDANLKDGLSFDYGKNAREKWIHADDSSGNLYFGFDNIVSVADIQSITIGNISADMIN